MFISFRNEAEAISQANFDSSYILSLKLGSGFDAQGERSLMINSNVKNVTPNYKIYLDTLLILVGADEWCCFENSDQVRSIIFYWYENLQKAA